MNTRALMLSAAVAAFMSAPAFAAAPIDAIATTPQKTSALPNPLTIANNGGIKLTSGTVPLLTIDSNSVVTNNGTFTFTDSASAVGILIDGTKMTTGSFTNNGTINLTGSGNNKTALHLSGTGFYDGTITFGTASVVKVAGDGSTGILQDSAFILNGDLLLGGTFTMTPTQTNGTAQSGITLANLLGTIKGNVSVTTGAVYTAIGNNATGIVIAGPILPCDTAVLSTCTELGTFSNSGTIAVAGVASRSSKTANAESGSALVIESSVMGGILNNGPLSATGDSTANAIISANGVSVNGVSAPTLFIHSPATAAGNITIGLDTPDANGTNSFINRGNITAAPEDSNQSSLDIAISGAQNQTITFLGGFFNSGLINAQATSISPGNQVSATALVIGSYVTIPQIEVSGQSASSTNTNGVISASINGPEGGVATAILISGQPVSGTTPVTNVPIIKIDAGGRVLAVADTTDPTNPAVGVLEAIAIEDRSNSLVTLTNDGTISATATPLSNGHTSIARAVDTSFNTVGLNFTNTGTVVGDVLLGNGADTYTIQGNSIQQIATQNGDINFGTSLGGTNVDTLNVGVFSNVAGAITDQGTLDVNVATNAILTVKNLPTSVNNNLQVQTLNVAGGSQTSAGTLNITVSNGLATIPLIQASQEIDFGLGANLGVQFGGFVPQGGTFLLLSAPTGHLNIDASDIARYSQNLTGNGLPFLFNSATITKVTVGGTDILELMVSAKSAKDLNLTGLAAQLFPIASVAVAGDDALGAALITGINSPEQAQAAFDAFAPDVSGGTRAVALSLTDQATGVVAARQRQLRLFSKSPGELTLWGNEFGEYLSTHGQTKTGVVGQTLPTGTVCAAKCPSISLSGFKDHGFGFSLGLDGGAPELGWYGGAFTFYTGDVQAGRTSVAPNSKTGELWYLLTGYTDWRGKGLFVDTQVSVGYGQLKGKRFLTLQIPVTNGFNTFRREADNTHAALVGALGATAGAVMKYSWATVTPQVSLDAMTLRQEGFTEKNGGTGFNLAVKSAYANSLRLFLGTEAREDIDVGDFFLQPSARVGYRFDLLNGAEKVHAQFADINSTLSGSQPGALFSIQGPDPSRGNIVGGLNLNATTDNWTIGLSYDFVRGSNNATEQSGTISLLGRI